MPFLKRTSTFLLRAPLALAALSILIPGCRNQASEELARRALRSQSQPSRAGLDTLRGATSKDFELAGRDSKRRPAWRLQARQARVGAGQNPASPARASLLGARAEVFSEGVLESSFQAAKIEFVTVSVSAPNGKTRRVQRLELSGGVRAQTVPPQSLLKGKAGSSKAGLSPPQLASAPVLLEAPRVTVNLSDRTVWVPASAVVQQKGSGVRVSAKTLRGDSGLRRLDLSGVQANSPQGRVSADRASYNWKAGRLLAQGHVQARAPIALKGQAPTNLLLTGERLDADASGQSGLLSGNVRAQTAGAQNGQNAQSGAASAGQIRFSWRDKSVQARGGVSFAKDGATIKAREVSTDTDFSQATASGGARFQKDGAVVTAERVRAFNKFTRAVASGGVRLAASTSKGPATLSASRVEAFDNFSRALASGEVVLKQGAATVRAANVQAFDFKGAGRAVASGGVSLVRDDLTVSANRVEAANLRDRNGFSAVASGGVRARNTDGRVSSQSVRWANGRVEARGSVSLFKDGATLSGDSLSSDQKFQNARLAGDVRGQFDGSTVSAGRIDKLGTRLVASGGVRARQGEISLRMARMEATIANGKSLSGDVVGSGGVVLTTRDGTTISAPSVRYNQARDEARAEDGALFVNKKQGASLRVRSLLVRHVSDDKRRTVAAEDGSGSGSLQALEDFRL